MFVNQNAAVGAARKGSSADFDAQRASDQLDPCVTATIEAPAVRTLIDCIIAPAWIRNETM